MLIFLATLLATVSSIVRSRAALELENLALRHQIGVLQRCAPKRPKLILLDRLLWAWLSLPRPKQTEATAMPGKHRFGGATRGDPRFLATSVI